MLLNFQERPWDLITAMSYTFAMSAVLLGLGIGNIFAIVLVLFLPGYVLVAAIFPGTIDPGRPELDWTVRIALSSGFSLVVVPLLGLVLNFSPWGIRFVPIVATIAVFTICLGCVAYWRRMRLPAELRLSLSMNLNLPDWKQYAAIDKVLMIALAASVVVASGTLAYVITAPLPEERFTEFYIVGSGGNASDYPTNLSPSEPGTVIIGVVNHEATSVTYTVRVDLIGVEFVFNSTSGTNETAELNRTENISKFSFALAAGQNWTQLYTFSIPTGHFWRLQFFLFRDNDTSTPYRALHLYVSVA